MMYREVADLISYEPGHDADGYPADKTLTERTVYVDVGSVKREEYYKAKQNGFDLIITFTMRLCDYRNERIVLFGDKEYQVERSYSPDGEFVELNCYERKAAKR